MNSVAFFSNAAMLYLQSAWPLLAGALGAALLAGVIQLAVSMDDKVVGFSAKLAGALLAVYFFSPHLLSELSAFAERMWGGADIYR